MAPQSWPVPQDQFFDLLGVESSTFGLPDDLSPSVTGGGDVIAHRRGARLWQGEVVLGRSEHANIAAQSAMIEHLLEPGASFMIHDRRLPPPVDPAYPGGVDWDSWPVAINALPAGNREIGLRGMPPGFTLRRGQLLGWQYLSGPVRHAVHRIVTADVTADATGVTPAFEVTPFIRPGAVVGASAILAWPACKAKMLSWTPGSGRSGVSRGGSFTWQQTLR